MRILLPVGIKYNEVIILGHILLQTIVLSQECNQLLAGSIVGKLFWPDSFDFKHFFENSSSVATSLHIMVDVEV